MKKVRIVCAVLFALSVFAAIDLGLNFMFNIVPEFADGLGTYSFLQGIFKIFGDSNWTLSRFFFAFEKAVWVSFVLLVINIVLLFKDNKKDNKKD